MEPATDVPSRLQREPRGVARPFARVFDERTATFACGLAARRRPKASR